MPWHFARRSRPCTRRSTALTTSWTPSPDCRDGCVWLCRSPLPLWRAASRVSGVRARRASATSWKPLRSDACSCHYARRHPVWRRRGSPSQADCRIGREGPLIEVGRRLGCGGRPNRPDNPQSNARADGSRDCGWVRSGLQHAVRRESVVLETIAGIAAPELLLPVMAATVGAAGIMRATVGDRSHLRATRIRPRIVRRTPLIRSCSVSPRPSLLSLSRPCSPVLERWFDTHPVPQPLRATLGGFLVGAIAIWLPAVVGNGYEPLNRILDSGIAVSAVVVLVIAKIIATSGSVASGIPGGIFTPMLLVGAALGAGWSNHRELWSCVRRRQLRTRRNGCRHSRQYPRTADRGRSWCSSCQETT